jgi:HPt (histidine-containing phosphotransfer) domain-containing protein
MSNIHPYVDMMTLKELATLDDSPDFVPELLQSGNDQVRDALPQLDQYAVSNEPVEYRKVIHYLKGALVTIGLTYMSEICLEILEPSQNITPESMKQWNNELKKRMDETISYLQEHNLTLK